VAFCAEALQKKENYGANYGDLRKGDDRHDEVDFWKIRIQDPKYFKVCVYDPASTCDAHGSCLLVENSECFNLPNGDSFHATLIGEHATVLYYQGTTGCNTQTPIIYLNLQIDQCSAYSPFSKFKVERFNEEQHH